jgi:O-antigen/teichoic acid export membrane protein
MSAPRPGRAAVAAGVADAGLASLATFAVGVYAIRALEPRALGAYALVFTAFTLLAVVPTQLLYVPAETAAASLPRGARSAVLPRSLRAGLPAAALAALALPAWALAAPPGIPARAALVLTATAVACTLVSPAQDHLRRMLHVAGRSGAAALVSTVQLATVAVAIVAAPRLAVSAAWVPFGALAAANVLSLSAGVVILRGEGRSSAAEELDFRALAETGRWLLLASAIAPASAFAASAVAGHLAGPAALGVAEAARVIGHPVLVLATGLSAVLGPRSVRAAAARRAADARRVAALFQALTLGGGAAYLAAASFAWPLNPFPALVPGAYAVAGLAAAAIVAAMANGALFPARSELLGAARAGSIARADAAGAALRVGVAATAGVTGALAVPLGFLALGLVRWAGYRRALRGVYSSSGETVIEESVSDVIETREAAAVA